MFQVLLKECVNKVSELLPRNWKKEKEEKEETINLRVERRRDGWYRLNICVPFSPLHHRHHFWYWITHAQRARREYETETKIITISSK